jgi:energy-converting hydrogenase A subunit R
MTGDSPRCIAFDLEGPLTSQDAAFELMGLVPGGHEVFQAISRYDDILALSNRPDYEPGDTLALIVPFLLRHRLGAADIQRLAEGAPLIQGARELMERLAADGYQVCCITTTYEQYARRLTQRLGLPPERVACTAFPIDELRARLGDADLAAVDRVEAALVRLDVEKDEEHLRDLLDAFYWRELPGTPLGDAVVAVKPVGGKRKVQALGRFAKDWQLELSRWTVVGDSITDNAMLTSVRIANGLAVVFNGNRYALECGNVSVASLSLADVLPLVKAWEEGEIDGARRFISRQVKPPDADGPHYHWLADEDITAAVEVHARFRRLVRQAAAALG